MHEHLRACISDIGALQCGQKVKRTEKVEGETDAWTQIDTRGNAGKKLFRRANNLNVIFLSKRESVYATESFCKLIPYHSTFTHSV